MSRLGEYRYEERLLNGQQDFAVPARSDVAEWTVRPSHDPRSYSWKRDVRADADIEAERLERAIEESRVILGTRIDWEDDESPFYSKDTFDRAVGFLRRMFLHSHSCAVTGLGIPQINPSDKGSIDIFWNSDASLLLINVPADSGSPFATAYGKKEGSEFSSTFDLNKARPELISWLTT